MKHQPKFIFKNFNYEMAMTLYLVVNYISISGINGILSDGLTDVRSSFNKDFIY